MSRLSFRLLAALALAATPMTGCSGLSGTYVHQGHVGLLINDFSGQIEQVLDPGYRFTMPLNKHIIEFPILKQQYVMVKAGAEGQVQGDDSVKVNSAEGQAFQVDASVDYHIKDKESVQKMYARYGKDFEDIVNNYYRSKFRTSIINGFANLPLAEGITTDGRKKAEAYATQDLNKSMADDGVIVDDVLIREVHVPDAIATSIAAKTAAESELVKSRTVAQQKVVEAQAEAAANVASAEGEAKARLIRARAEAEANRQLAGSITPNLVHMRFIDKIADKIQLVLPEKTFLQYGGGLTAAPTKAAK